jgi:hypothetical protein
VFGHFNHETRESIVQARPACDDRRHRGGDAALGCDGMFFQRSRCAWHASVSGIPSGAHEMDSGTANNEIGFTAHGEGRAYIYDVDQKRVLFDSRLHEGERFALDLHNNRATH